MPGTTFLEERIFGNICLCFSLCCALSRDAWNNSFGGEIILLEIAVCFASVSPLIAHPEMCPSSLRWVEYQVLVKKTEISRFVVLPVVYIHIFLTQR